MGKRMITLYSILIFCFSILILRVYVLTQSTDLTAAAASQSTYTVDVTKTRGAIYDANLNRLTDTKEDIISVVAPSPESMMAVASNVTGPQRQIILNQMTSGLPFLCQTGKKIYSKGIENFTVTKRWEDNALAPHILGYLDGEGKAVNGIELAYDQLLAEAGEEVKVRYTVDGMQSPLPESIPEIIGSSQPPKAGVVLTLDKEIQQMVQSVAEESIAAGAVVVMDVETGKIRACASVPTFSPSQVAQALQDQASPLFNRAFAGYSVGSTFKLAVAAAALEQGVPTSTQETCLGGITVNGRMFYCHNRGGHGEVDMQEAIEQSCNPYFVKLGQETGGANIIYMAQAMGFGAPAEFAPGVVSSGGYLPAVKEITNNMDLANLSFGQGTLLATPVQIAAMVSSIANGGYAVVPSLVEGITQDGKAVEPVQPEYVRNKIMSSTTADTLRRFMVAVVEEGSGTGGKPEEGGAGGKTASAQTGHYNETGEEIVHAWFAGFFPEQQPKYAVVVLVEGGEFGGKVASPIFKRIADEIYSMEGKIE